MRILVIGAGAVGGYFGGRLRAAGRNVTFLVRAGRAAQLERTGLRIFDAAHGDLTLAPQQLKLLTAGQLRDRPETYDLVLLSAKAYSLDAAMEDVAPAMGPETVVLPLLNGMRHLDALQARFGSHAVLGGATYLVADLDAEGAVRSMAALHDLNFGERGKQVTARIQTIAAALTGAGFDARLRPDILATMWQKWTMLASAGAINCLLRSPIGAAVSAPGGRETARQVMTECETIAAANGYPAEDLELRLATEQRLLNRSSTLTTSMYRDMQRGLPVEADHILGDLVERGRRHGVEAPLLRAAYAQLSVYAAGLARESAKASEGPAKAQKASQA